MKIKTNIRSTILIPLGVMALFFIVFTCSVYIAINKLYSSHTQTYTSSIPELTEITSITDELKNLQIDVYRIFQESEQLIFEIELKNIKNRVDILAKRLNDKKENVFLKKTIGNILQQLTSFKIIFENVSNYVSERIQIENLRQNFIKKIRYLNQQLLAYKYQNTLEEKGSLLAKKIIDNLFILNVNTDIFYGAKIYNLLLNDIIILKEIQNELIQNSNTSSRKLSILIQRIFELVEHEKNIVETFFAYEKNFEEKTSLKIQLNVLYSELNQINLFLLNQLSLLSDQYSNEFKESIESISLFIIITFLVLFSIAIFVYKLLSNYIVNPLVSLNIYLKNYETQKDYKPNIKGAIEVVEIANATYSFAEQLDDREKRILNSHNNLEKLVEERTKKISQLSEQIISLQEEERIKLAAELHDDIGSSIGTIKLCIERASKLLEKTSIQETQETLNSTVQIIKSVTRQLRRIQTDLRPPHLNLGLLKTLEWYVIDYRIAHPEVEIQADFFFDELLLSPSLRIVTFRIVQEAMNNVSKHSLASKVNIKILDDDGFTIIIEDNGKGFNLELFEKNDERISHGIRNIQERVTISGGDLKITSSIGEGTCVTAHWNMN